jgi:hypothetical protein
LDRRSVLKASKWLYRVRPLYFEGFCRVHTLRMPSDLVMIVQRVERRSTNCFPSMALFCPPF